MTETVDSLRRVQITQLNEFSRKKEQIYREFYKLNSEIEKIEKD